MTQPPDTVHGSDGLDRRFRQRHRAWRIIAFMRWVTMVLGPAALFVDRLLVPLLLKYEVPDVVTFEDLMQWLILSVLPLDLWIDIDLFHSIYFHVTRLSCVLFVVFVVWTYLWKQKAEAAADELAHGQARMTEEIDLG